MPRKCCYPGCKSNYGRKTEVKPKTVTTFSFPKDEALKQLWGQAINRKNWAPTPYSAVCIQHFEKDQVITTSKLRLDTGEVVLEPLTHPTLVKGAVPLFCPDQPQSPPLADLKHKVNKKMRNNGKMSINKLAFDAVKRCLVKDCKLYKKSSSVRLLSLPASTKMCQKWLTLCHRQELLSESIDDLQNIYGVCSKHFSNTSFREKSKNKLKSSAVPKLRIPRPALDDSSDDETLAQVSIKKESSESVYIKIEPDDLADPEFIEVDTNVLCCRLCANSVHPDDTLSIFDSPGVHMKINVCLPIEVNPTEELPKSICVDCHENLKSNYKFHVTVRKADEILRKAAENKKKSKNIINIQNDHIYSRGIVKTGAGECKKESDSKNETLDDKKITFVALDGNDDSNDWSDNDADLNDSFEIPLTEPCDSPPVKASTTSSEKAINKPLMTVLNTPLSKEMKRSLLNLPKKSENQSVPENKPELTKSIGSQEIKVEPKARDYWCVLCKCDISATEGEIKEHIMKNHAPLKKIKTDDALLLPKIEPIIKMSKAEAANLIKAFKRSMKNKAHAKDLSCSICNVSFASYKRLNIHKLWHESDNPGKCTLCDKSYPEEQLLYQHMYNMHTPKKEKGSRINSKTGKMMDPFCCSVCGARFKSRATRLRHEKWQHGKNHTSECQSCLHCMEAFPTSHQVMEHVLSSHTLISQNESSCQVLSVNRLYACEYCYKYYTTVVGLDRHRSANHETPLFNCRICPLQFEQYADLMSHMANIAEHTVPHNKVESWLPIHIRELMVCQYCARTFKNYEMLSHHILRDHNQKLPRLRLISRKFECNECGRKFYNKSSLRSHLNMHTGERPYMCEICGKTFAHASSIAIHKRSAHTTEKPYSCPRCPKTFKYKGDRNNHNNRHDNARPFQCVSCPRAFKSKADLRGHVKVHTDARPYLCGLCNATFKKSFSLKMHNLIHTGEKSHICKFCGRPFGRLGDLSKHVRVLHGSK